MTKSIRPYLIHIRQALTAIDTYRPHDKKAFQDNPMAQDAILMRLQEIGENLAQWRRLDEDAFAAVADDSWYKLIGLRNVISHGYHSVDRDEIWQIVTGELPAFAATIEACEDL